MEYIKGIVCFILFFLVLTVVEYVVISILHYFGKCRSYKDAIKDAFNSWDF